MLAFHQSPAISSEYGFFEDVQSCFCSSTSKKRDPASTSEVQYRLDVLVNPPSTASLSLLSSALACLLSSFFPNCASFASQIQFYFEQPFLQLLDFLKDLLLELYQSFFLQSLLPFHRGGQQFPGLSLSCSVAWQSSVRKSASESLDKGSCFASTASSARNFNTYLTCCCSDQILSLVRCLSLSCTFFVSPRFPFV